MYAKCGSIDDAWRVFNRMPTQDVVSWSVMILGHVKVWASTKGIGTILRNAAALEEGRKALKQIIQNGYGSDVFVGNRLVDMYTECGSIEDAWKVFNSMSSHNMVAWDTMILAHVKCG